MPGLYYGRYPGDHYAGGNPWVLLTSINAEIFYLAAKQVKPNGFSRKDIAAWSQLLAGLTDSTSQTELIAKLISAGDSIMNKIYDSVKNDDFRLDEQMDRDSGA